MSKRIKTLFFVLAAGSILLLQMAECGNLDQKAMQCCATMPCAPAMQNHKCCQTLVGSETTSLRPTARQSLQPPVLAVLEYSRVLPAHRFIPEFQFRIEAQQHSPPELYTHYHSFLI